MMRSKRHQEATYWAVTGENDYNEETFATPVLLYVHWEDKQEVMRTSEGEEFTSKAVVYTGQEVNVDDYLVQGDYTEVADPVMAGARQIRATQTISSLRTNQEEVRAFL